MQDSPKFVKAVAAQWWSPLQRLFFELSLPSKGSNCAVHFRHLLSSFPREASTTTQNKSLYCHGRPIALTGKHLFASHRRRRPVTFRKATRNSSFLSTTDLLLIVSFPILVFVYSIFRFLSWLHATHCCCFDRKAV